MNGTTGPTGTKNDVAIQVQALNKTVHQGEKSIYKSMGQDFVVSVQREYQTSLNNARQLQLGKLITLLPKLLFMSVHLLGKMVQGGNDIHGGTARYLVGGAVKMLANGADYAVEVGRATIDSTIIFTKSLAIFFLIDLTGYEFCPDCVNFKLDEGRIPTENRASTKGYASLMRAAISSMGVDCLSGGLLGIPGGFSKAELTDLPDSIMAKRADYPQYQGSRLALHAVDQHGVLVLRGDRWSDLRVGVFKTIDDKSKQTKIVLCFAGTDPLNRPASVKSDINLIAGVRDSAAIDADLLVRSFVEQYRVENVVLVGHSLGGNLAADAGLLNKIQEIYLFNALGLSQMQMIDHRQQINDIRLDEDASIKNFNVERDFLNTLQRLMPTTQVGQKLRIEGAQGHKMADITEGLAKAPASPPTTRFGPYRPNKPKT